MSGEQIIALGAAKMLESSGAAVVNNAIGAADDASYSLSTDGNGFPDAVFALTLQFATAPAEGMPIALWAQPLNVDGAGNNSQVPEANRPTKVIGYFIVDNVTTAQYIELVAYDLPRNANYFIYNAGTGQAVSAGWKLTVVPRTFKIAP